MGDALMVQCLREALNIWDEVYAGAPVDIGQEAGAIIAVALYRERCRQVLMAAFESTALPAISADPPQTGVEGVVS